MEICVGITNLCNARCIMCGSQEKQVQRGYMDENIFDSLVSKLPEKCGIEFNSLGEPTLHPNFLSFVRKLADKKIRIKMSTNGTYSFNDEKFQEFIDCLSQTESEVNFSIDGATKAVYESVRKGCLYEDVFGNLKKLLSVADRKFSIGINYCVMLGNSGEIPLLLRNHPNIDSIYLNMLIISGPRIFNRSLYSVYPDAKRDINNAVEEAKRLGITVYGNCLPDDVQQAKCSFPKYLWMDWNGNLFPCCRRFDLPLGNIVNDDLHQMIEKCAHMPDMESDFCKTCLTPGSRWSWRRHFATEEIRDEYIVHYWKAQEERSTALCKSQRGKERDDLSKLIEIMNTWKESNHSVLYTFRIFNKFRSLFEKFKLTRGSNDYSVVELGYGFTQVSGKLFSRQGTRYFGIEPWKHINVDDELTDTILDTWAPAVCLNEYIEHPTPDYVSDISELADNSADVLFSNAVLEHIENPDSVIAHTARVLKSGGHAVHQVDISDHRNKGNPSEFLQSPDDEWSDIKYSYGAINRLRTKDWISLFEKHGFCVVDLFIHPWAGLEEGSFRIVLKLTK